jgi:hypothetical protein
MSVEAWTITPPYTISGTGPYEISHPYVSGAIRAYVQLDAGRLELNGTEFAVSPTVSDTTGNVTLSPTVATTYAGRTLIIDRITPDEQGWLAVQGEREAGLAAQLDRMVQSDQELRARGAGALRIRGNLEPFDWAEGTVPIIEGGLVKSGPTATAIAEAQTRAIEAANAAAAAADSAAEALAKENSMLRDRGAWATLTLYSPSDIFTSAGTSYITQIAHIASNIAADQAAGRIRVFAAKGDAGPGTGDMLKTENLAGLTNVPQARTNLGLQALAIKSQAAFADIDPAAVITDVETLAANKVNNAFATAKAVTDYIDPQLPKVLANKVITGAPAANMILTEFNNSLYSRYKFELENFLPVTNAAGLWLRLSTNGGGVWDSGPSDYSWLSEDFATGGYSSAGGPLDVMGITRSAVSNISGHGVNGELHLINAGNSAAFSKVYGYGSFLNSSPFFAVFRFAGYRVLAQDTDAVQFFFSSGNIAVGSRIRMTGYP